MRNRKKCKKGTENKTKERGKSEGNGYKPPKKEKKIKRNVMEMKR